MSTIFSPLKIVIVFVCLVCNLCAQQTKIDSLQNLLKSDKQDTLKVKHLNQLSWNLKNIGNSIEAEKKANEALELSSELNFKSGIAESYNMIGNVQIQQGNFHKALDNFLIALSIRKKTGDKNGMAAAYNNIALMNDYLGEPGKALENYAEAIKLNKETGNKNWLANNYNNVGGNYSNQGKYDDALENFENAKKIKEELGETTDPQYANNVSNIGNIYFYKGNLDKALEIFNTALKIRLSINDKNGVSDSYILLGSVFFEKEKTEKNPVKQKELTSQALTNFSQALTLKEEIGDMYGVAMCRQNIGALYFKNNNLDEARKVLLVGLDISKEIDSKDLVSSTYKLLACCDSAAGNWESAYAYEKLFKAYNDSLFNEENSKKITEMNAKFESEKKETQILQLEQEKERTKFLIIIFSALGLIVLFLGWRAYANKKKVAEFMASENNRKEVLLQEVHHRINNNLQIISSLLTLQANSAQDEKLHEYLKQSQNRIQSLSALHELLYQNDSPLKISMKEYLDKVLDFHRNVLGTLSGKIDLILDITEEEFVTKTAVPIALIVNELVTNSIKYAFDDGKDGFIKISLTPTSENTWKLHVSDSGKGLPLDTNFRKDSLGVRLVTLMTKQIKGELIRSNSPGATFDIVF